MARVGVILPVVVQDKLLLKLLASIEKQKYPKKNIEVIVVDNGGKNSKLEIGNPKLRIRIIKNSKNVGFVKAVNQGIEKSKADFFFITNADVVLDKNCFKNLIRVALLDSRVGVVGPGVYSLEKLMRVSNQDMPGFKTDFFWGRPSSLSTKKLAKLKDLLEVDWISGSGMMIKREVVDKVGLFDERFFAYWEDADFGVRAKKAGFEVVIVPQAKIYHQGSVVMGKTSPEKTYYLVRNNLLFLFKHTRLIGKIRLHFRNLSLIILKFLKLFFKISKNENLAFINGILDFYRRRFGERRQGK